MNYGLLAGLGSDPDIFLKLFHITLSSSFKLFKQKYMNEKIATKVHVTHEFLIRRKLRNNSNKVCLKQWFLKIMHYLFELFISILILDKRNREVFSNKFNEPENPDLG